jgi:16S rRNA (adenine(1408)-N(1))-methyltransferase
LGTGDGRYVLDEARRHPDALYIGIDACRDGLMEASKKASKKPARGGAPNALFVLCAAEKLPPTLCGIADAVTVNYPWGSLLQAMVNPNEEVLTSIARLAKPGAEIRILLNWSVLENHAYCQTLGLPSYTLESIKSALKPAYARVGIEIDAMGLVHAEAKTTWGQKLVRGSQRKVLEIRARCCPLLV